jgi:hypothetical protein
MLDRLFLYCTFAGRFQFRRVYNSVESFLTVSFPQEDELSPDIPISGTPFFFYSWLLAQELQRRFGFNGNALFLSV